MANDSPIPADLFSQELRKLRDNPGAISSTSTIDSQDFYGNAATWVVETFRDGDGSEKVFIQRNDAAGGQRWVLPEKVTAALARHRDQLATRTRRRQGHRLVAQRKERGDRWATPRPCAPTERRRGRRQVTPGEEQLLRVLDGEFRSATDLAGRVGGIANAGSVARILRQLMMRDMVEQSPISRSRGWTIYGYRRRAT